MTEIKLQSFRCARKNLMAFIKNYRWALITGNALLILAYYNFIVNTNLRIDTTILFVSPGDEFNEVELGRFGIILTNKILGLSFYNHYLVGFLTLIMLAVVNVYLCYTLHLVTGKSSKPLMVALPLILFLQPVWAEQLYFSFQSFLIMLSMFSCILAARLIWVSVNKNSKLQLLFASALCFFSFSIYQAFVPLAACVFCLINLADMLAHPEKADKKYMLRCVIINVSVIVLALILYLGANKIAQIGSEKSNYLTGQIKWGTMPLFGVIINIFTSIWSVLAFRGRLDTPAFLLAMLFSLGTLILHLVVKRDRKLKGAYIGAWLFIQLTTFAMTFVLGQRGQLHSELALPMTVMSNVYIAWLTLNISQELIKTERLHCLVKPVSGLCTIAVLLWQSPIVFRQFFTDDIRYMQDHDLARQIIERVDRLCGDDGTKTVLLVGEKKNTLPASCVIGDVIGVSMFEYHIDFNQTNYIESDLLQAMGREYGRWDEEMMLKAHDLAETMTDFPDEGSVVMDDSLIVVRLSYDLYWKAERLTASVERTEDSPHREEDFTQEALAVVETAAIKDDLTIDGFALIRGIPSAELDMKVLLHACDTDEYFLISSAPTYKRYISNTYWQDNTDYDCCGFRCLCPADFLEQSPDTIYNIVVSLTNENGTVYCKTDTYISYNILARAKRPL